MRLFPGSTANATTSPVIATMAWFVEVKSTWFRLLIVIQKVEILNRTKVFFLCKFQAKITVLVNVAFVAASPAGLALRVSVPNPRTLASLKMGYVKRMTFVRNAHKFSLKNLGFIFWKERSLLKFRSFQCCRHGELLRCIYRDIQSHYLLLLIIFKNNAAI